MRANGSVHRIHDMIGNSDVAVGTDDGHYYRAVPEPFRGGILCRLRSCWEIIRGRAFAVDWPNPGDLERILRNKGARSALTRAETAGYGGEE